jgi:hypothetical protein
MEPSVSLMQLQYLHMQLSAMPPPQSFLAADALPALTCRRRRSSNGACGMRLVPHALFLAASLAAVAPAPAEAIRDCRLVPDIVSVAGFLLADPKTERRFWRDHVSTDAAYLLIRYGGLSGERAMGLVESLRQRRVAPQRIQDLRLALAPPDRRLALIEDMQEGASVPPGGPSFFRAMIVDRRAGWLFADMARRAANAGADRAAVTRFQFSLASSLVDLDDAALGRIAAEAETHGLWPLALELQAARPSPAGWLAALRRSPLAPDTQEKLTEAFAPHWRGFRHLRPRPYRFEDLPAELKLAVAAIDGRASASARDFEAATHLVRLVPQTRGLLTVLNQTGEVRLAREVAAPLVRDIEARRIDPAREGDLVEARMLEGIVAVLGAEPARRQLVSFRDSGPPPTETALQAAERSVAVTTLAPLARGDLPAAPDRPAILSRGFDWAGWRSTAEAIRTGGEVSYVYRGAAAELLSRIGRHHKAAEMLAVMGPTDEARRIGHAILLGLDRACAGLIWPNPVLGDPVYRFDAR